MSLFSNLWSAIHQRQKETQQQVKREWKSFVLDVAEEREVDETAILIALEQFKQTPDDLQAAVELLQRRQAMVADIGECRKADAEIPAIEAEGKRLHDEFEPIRQKFEEATLQAEWRIRSRKEKRSKLRDIQQQLIESAGAEYHSKIKELRERAVPLNREINRLKELASVRKSELEAAIRNNTPGWTNSADLLAELPKVAIASTAELAEAKQRVLNVKTSGEAEIAQIEGQISELTAKVQAIESEIKAIEESMLDPMAI